MMDNRNILLNIINPTSTNIKGDVVLNMYSSGYLTARGKVTLNEVMPMYFGLEV